MSVPLQKAVVDFAIANIWCEPRQDKQNHVRPKRISRYNGAYKSFSFLSGEVYDLPDKTNRWHVYQVGQLTPAILGILNEIVWASWPTPTSTEIYSTSNTWKRITDICNDQALVIDLYIAAGIQFPRHEAYMMFTNNRNLVFAVKKQPKIEANFDHKPEGEKRLDLDNLMIHFYSNAFFDSERAMLIGQKIATDGRTINNLSDIMTVQSNIDAYLLQGGAVIIHVNGCYMEQVNLGAVVVGDVVDWLWDNSVKKVVDISLANPQSFDSTLDGERKYLISYEPDINLENIIDYKDDVDFFLINPDVDGFVKGRFFHRSRYFSTRMITHRDYSIPISLVEAFVDDVSYFNNINELSVRLYLRNSGYARPLTYEANKIHELYKMPYADVRGALVGIDATVDCWNATNLEACPYTELMRTRYESVTLGLCQEAMGYNAISALIGETPLKFDDYNLHFNLPIGATVESVIFEYDADGNLLEYRQHSNATYTHRDFPETILADALLGTMNSGKQDVIYGNDNVTLEDGVGYRFYRTRKISSIIDEGYWEDVTGDTSAYLIVGDEAVWVHDDNLYYGLVKTDKLVYVKSFQIDNAIDHLLHFTVGETAVFNGINQTRLMPIPPGRLELFMNKRALIPNLDYYVQWPNVVVTNRSYFIDDQPQDFVMRLTGFCDENLQPDGALEYGFIFNGKLSRNNVFDIRDDHVIALIVDGGTYHRDIVQFVEDNLPPMVSGFDNGVPYMLRDVLVPIGQAITPERTSYEMRQEAKVKDNQISDYLTAKMPEIPDVNPNIFPSRHSLFSPFISKIIHDLVENLLDITDLGVNYSDMELISKLGTYEWLLDYEPSLLNEDGNYVEIRPHPHETAMHLFIGHYTFVDRAIRVYCNNRIDLTPYVTVGPS